MPEEIKKIPKLNALLVQKDQEYKYVEPDEWYVAKFLEAESRQGKYGPYIRFVFELLNGEFEDGTSARGHRISSIHDAIIAPSKKLYKWVSVMLGREPKLDESFDLTAYYGEKFRVLVRDRPKKKGEDDGKRYQQVDSIKRKGKEEK